MDDAPVPHGSTSQSPYIVESEEWQEGLSGTLLQLEIEGVPAFEYVLTGLTGAQKNYNMATFRMVRRGGPARSDVAHQHNLFNLIGAITVAAGHVEAEMKRVILIASGGTMQGFIEVDERWSDLEKKLGRLAEEGGELGPRIAEVLAWAAEHNLSKVRNDAVHSAWCLHDIGHIEGSRFRKKADGETLVSNVASLARQATLLFEYVGRLHSLVVWPTAVLPPIPPVALEVGAVTVRIENGPHTSLDAPAPPNPTA